MEAYSSGLRGSPAKGVGRETDARIQIPSLPPYAGIAQRQSTNLVSWGSRFQNSLSAPNAPLAQQVRALALHARGQRFESVKEHHEFLITEMMQHE